MAKTQLEINAAAANLAKSGLDELALQGNTRIDNAQICDTIARLFAARAEELRTQEGELRASFVEKQKALFATHEAEELPKLEAKAEQQRAIDEVARAVKAKVP